MSVLVAALTRTKNNFTASFHSKSKNEMEKHHSGVPKFPVMTVSAPAPVPVPTPAPAPAAASAGPSKVEDHFPTELLRQFSSHSCFDSEEEECDSAPVADEYTLKEGLGPMVALKEQLEKDKVRC
jgi:hypothetical protein